ncbi:uncharacterized protein LOC106530123 isoform X2 [Austrofundulus limnaeus]|uniref:Uncharacterized protein LOC106530123 isoform X2 n=1 Tax=Austrofundulus limnaeus TaxID=52670 RepID=A0A2I4CMD5_AUSLI|nr:PREDICTED: uncharacterized protein LOC106530123 isoform X2 [Austrofundulus limnaeus]
MDCLQQCSQCPACKKEYNVALILPCSHSLCARCVAAGEGAVPRRPGSHSLLQPVCSVLCPCCRYHVELPCWTWSSATSCLPKHPTLNFPCDSTHTDNKSPEENDCDKPAPTHVINGAVDLDEEDMKQSVYGLCFALDPSSVPPSLHLSNSCCTVSYCGGSLPALHLQNQTRVNSDCVSLPHVCADVVITRGQYYWEVDVCNSSVYRVGVMSLDGSGWWLETNGLSFSAVYDGSCETVCTVPPKIKTLGIFLNVGGGTISFYNPLTQEHLASLPTRFSPAGVLPFLSLGQGKLRLRCGLPPPSFVFLGKSSAYRGRCKPSGAQWRSDVSFPLVRRVIEKFERLASNSDSDPVSSFASSSCSLMSPPGGQTCDPLPPEKKKKN